LKVALQSLGLLSPFEGGTGFCGLIKNDCLFIDRIIQKTTIHVKEDGTLAAAATAVMLDRSGPVVSFETPVVVIADHPFQIFIYDSVGDVALFEGVVYNPTVPSGSVISNSKGKKHSDADFWTANFNVDPSNTQSGGGGISVGVTSSQQNDGDRNLRKRASHIRGLE